jgi:hypothetical protein
MEAKYRILENAALSRQRRDTRPVLDQMNSTSVIKQIRIGNKCGSDNICYPALRVSARESVFPLTYSTVVLTQSFLFNSLKEFWSSRIRSG